MPAGGVEYGQAPFVETVRERETAQSARTPPGRGEQGDADTGSGATPDQRQRLRAGRDRCPGQEGDPCRARADDCSVSRRAVGVLECPERTASAHGCPASARLADAGEIMRSVR